MLENKNIEIKILNNNGYKNMPYVKFVSYDKEISLNYIKKELTRILNEYKECVIYAEGFNFDGLYETNKTLIKEGCNIYDNKNGNSVYFEGIINK